MLCRDKRNLFISSTSFFPHFRVIFTASLSRQSGVSTIFLVLAVEPLTHELKIACISLFVLMKPGVDANGEIPQMLRMY